MCKTHFGLANSSEVICWYIKLFQIVFEMMLKFSISYEVYKLPYGDGSIRQRD